MYHQHLEFKSEIVDAKHESGKRNWSFLAAKSRGIGFFSYLVFLRAELTTTIKSSPIGQISSAIWLMAGVFKICITVASDFTIVCVGFDIKVSQ